MKRTARPRYREIHPGIFMIRLPLAGKRPGPINAYFFTGETPALVDTGTRRTARILEKALGDIGYSFRDIRRIVITHGHVDHYGAARRIARAAGSRVEVAAHEADRTPIERGLEVPRSRFLGYYRLMGVPFLFKLSLLPMRLLFSSLAENCPVDRFISDGETVRLGDYNATVIATPGHTKGSVSLYLEREGILFPGDHILGHITPNAFVMLDEEFDLPRRMSQVEFYNSLAIIEKLAPGMVFPAHGEPIEDVGAIITMFREQFALRRERIMKILVKGEFTAYRIARLLFPEIRGVRLPLEIYLAVSEVYTHIQVLLDDGAVTRRMENGALLFRAGPVKGPGPEAPEKNIFTGTSRREGLS
ncbi:MAG: MBL fold metallo-hydrolase [Spirochaetes bacterium]|nr:MBL fold metallo-hydrolase [Spirochaetota bacterium]